MHIFLFFPWWCHSSEVICTWLHKDAIVLQGKAQIVHQTETGSSGEDKCQLPTDVLMHMGCGSVSRRDKKKKSFSNLRYKLVQVKGGKKRL